MKEIVADFEKSSPFQLKEVPHNSIQFAVFANQASRKNAEHCNPTAATVNREQVSTSRPRRPLNRPDERARYEKPQNLPVNLLGKKSRIFRKPVELKKQENMFLLETSNYKIIASIGLYLPSCKNCRLNWKQVQGQRLFFAYQLKLILKSKVTLVATETIIHDSNDKPIHIFGCLKINICARGLINRASDLHSV